MHDNSARRIMLLLVALLVASACGGNDTLTDPPGAEKAADGSEARQCIALEPAAESAAQNEVDPAALKPAGRYIVTYEEGYEPPSDLSLDLDLGRLARHIPSLDAIALELPEGGAQALLDQPGVRRVEPDPVRELYAFDDGEAVPEGVATVLRPGEPPLDVPLGAGGDATTPVCVIDSALGAHRDFEGLRLSGDVGEDTCGHGTHVAGTIAAVDDGAGVLGVAPGLVDLHVEGVFSGPECKWTYASDLIAAVEACEAAGAKVVNMSLGGFKPSQAEEEAFQGAYERGVLLVGASGNAGSTDKSYPASYPSVISVGAVDADGEVARFSQRNDAVDLVAPGVRVLSTLPFREVSEAEFADGSLVGGAGIAGAAHDTVVAALKPAGRCATRDMPLEGKIALCERGGVTFAEKVANAEASGARGVIVYNDRDGLFRGTLEKETSAIPAIGVSRADGMLMAERSGAQVTLRSLGRQAGNGYAQMSGTSMAAPHVAGVAALLWSFDPSWTAQDIRLALLQSAQDLGAEGRDDSYGHGLVWAEEAYRLLTEGGLEPPCSQ